MPEDVKCPICGSETIKRTAQKGQNVGSSFYVCNRYPECKGKVEITEEEDVDGFLVGQEEEDVDGFLVGPKNTSGQGRLAEIPYEIRGWSWGAFFLTWIWGIFNRVWLSLLCFVPVISWVMPFVLGFKGKEWAWQNKQWDSIEHFKRVQRSWALWGLVIFIVIWVFVFIIIIASIIAGR